VLSTMINCIVTGSADTPVRALNARVNTPAQAKLGRGTLENKMNAIVRATRPSQVSEKRGPAPVLCSVASNKARRLSFVSFSNRSSSLWCSDVLATPFRESAYLPSATVASLYSASSSFRDL